MNVKGVRRENLRALAKVIGGISALANRLGKSQGQISHLIGSHYTKNVGDKLAAEIERCFNKPPGWLDCIHDGLLLEMLEEKVNYIPLLASAHVQDWMQNSAALKYRFDFQQIAVATSFSPTAFALHVLNDSMETTHGGPSFPQNSIVIVDPEYVMKEGSFIVVSLDHSQELILRQVMHEGNQRYLKALNLRYPPISMKDPYTIYGVVRAVIHQLD